MLVEDAFENLLASIQVAEDFISSGLSGGAN
jgi:hypothetical protein